MKYEGNQVRVRILGGGFGKNFIRLRGLGARCAHGGFLGGHLGLREITGRESGPGLFQGIFRSETAGLGGRGFAAAAEDEFFTTRDREQQQQDRDERKKRRTERFFHGMHRKQGCGRKTSRFPHGRRGMHSEIRARCAI